MKKALIIANLGGFVEFLFSDIEILQNLGYEVTYAANTEIAEWGIFKEKLEEKHVPIKHICFASKKPMSKDNIIAYKQIKELLKENFDLIHCHTPITGILTKIACKKYRKHGTKLIYTTHGFTFTEYSSKKTWIVYHSIEKFSSKFCDAIITINKEDYENAKKMNCKKVYYINGVGVDIKKYSNINIDKVAYRKKIGVDLDKIMILSVGELSERKNHAIIIDALSKMKNKDSYTYVICGKGIDGGTGEFLKNKANELKVDLKLLGYRTDIPKIIHCSDIGALPSLREGLGLAGIQSLAAGIPLVATRVQGIKDYIIDGKNGFLCKPNDIEEFSKAIEKLSDFSVRKKMKEDCIKKAQDFDISISEKQRKKIYQEILR